MSLLSVIQENFSSWGRKGGMLCMASCHKGYEVTQLDMAINVLPWSGERDQDCQVDGERWRKPSSPS